MTVKEIFFKQLDFFSKPDAKLAKVDDGVNAATCIYRSADKTLRCAVGCLIPDEVYDKFDSSEVEGKSVVSLLEYFSFRMLFYEHTNRGDDSPTNCAIRAWLSDSQYLHDSIAQNPVDFCEKLCWMAVGAGIISPNTASMTVDDLKVR